MEVKSERTREEWHGRNKERNHAIWKERKEIKTTLGALAKKYGLTPERIRQIVAKQDRVLKRQEKREQRMVDDFYFTPTQKAVLDIVQGKKLSHYGEEDTDFHRVISSVVESAYISNVIDRGIPNLKALLKATEEELQQLPSFGKKTVAEIIKLRNKLERHRTLLPRLRAAIKAAKAVREYRIKHREIINVYLKLDKDSRNLAKEFNRTWDFYKDESRKWSIL